MQQVEAGTVYTVKVHGVEWTRGWELSIAAPCYIVRHT